MNFKKNSFFQSWILFQSISYNPLQALNIFELLLCAKSFPKFSGFLNLENLCYSFFSSLLPLPKRIRQGLTAWILFVSLFSLFQNNKGLTAWILCLNTLKGTSFVVQVEGTSTWVVVTENKRGYISCGSVQVEGTSTWLFKENKGGYIPCGSLLVKVFTRLKRNLKDRRSLGDWM